MKPALTKSVIYQIYLRAFTSDGTLKAAEEMIPHLYDMGIDIIYMSACNTEDADEKGQSVRQRASGMNNPKNPYRISDYFSVDEEYGTNEDLYSFIKTAHSYGIKVLIDLVFLHCGTNAVFIKEHPEFVIRDENGDILVGERWPFAVIDYGVPALREYMWSVMEYYIKEMKADGFRCDTGGGVPLDFWAEGTRRIREINPDAIMINEGSLPEYLSVFDINYSFPTIYAATNLFLDVNGITEKEAYEKRSPMTLEGFKKTFDEAYAGLPDGKFILLNSENHDTSSDLAEKRPEISLGVDGAEAIMAMLFTLKGIPMIYNGSEVADSAPKNMFWNRFCKGSMSVQWQNALTEKGKSRLSFVKDLIRIHRSYDAILNGASEWLDTGNDSILAYTGTKNNNSVTVMINISNKSQSISSAQSGKVILKKKVTSSPSGLLFAPFGILITEG